MELPVPARLTENARQTPAGRRWLEELSPRVAALAKQWALELAPPFEEEVSCSWVAPARRRDGSPAVFKICLPHLEAENEIAGLRFWNGDGTVRVLAADDAQHAMLLERCAPGTQLRRLPEPEQDVVIAALLRRLWRPVPAPHPFRSLAEMTAHWTEREPGDDEARWPDAGLVREGHRLYAELPRNAKSDVLLATDLHAGNVLRAERETWLVIDPKPFVGDAAYDATQHLMNCDDRMRTDAPALVARMAELLEVDAERVRLWTFARLAAGSRNAEFFARWGDRAFARLTYPPRMAAWSECTGPIRKPTDVLEWVAADTHALLVEARHFPAEFFDLKTGFAGELLQKLENYGIRVAAVFTRDDDYTVRFREFLSEARRRGSTFRVFATRGEAERWLSDG